jgi:hypothetical protein
MSDTVAPPVEPGAEGFSREAQDPFEEAEVVTSREAAPEAQPQDTQAKPKSKPQPTRPSKKATVSEMRSALAALELDTTGKKETLYK